MHCTIFLCRINFLIEFNATGGWGSTIMNYTEQLGNGTTTTTAYDANGKIKGLTRHGYQPHTLTSVVVDQLTYNYKANNKSNQLLNVIDAVNNPQTHLGDFRTSTQHTQSKNATTIDYEYDNNGNLIKDFNKDIKIAGNGITYNHLNLPIQIQVKKLGPSLAGEILYYYDATGGGKVRKQVKEYEVTIPVGTSTLISDITTTTFYADGLVYETKEYSDATLQPQLNYAMRLQYLLHEAGRLRYQHGTTPALNKLAYDYHLTDHVGNVRMMLTEEVSPLINFTATMETATRSVEEQFF